MPTVGQELLTLSKYRDEEAQLKKRYEASKAKREAHERKCMGRMETEEVESYKTRGKLFSNTGITYAQVQDRDAFLTWAHENEPELVKESESKGDLNALVRACLDDGKAFPPGVGSYEKNYISIRKA